MSDRDFVAFFQEATGFAALGWQARLAQSALPSDRLIRVPTGMGKTLGILLTWLYHAVELRAPGWPRRLVWCLPMRTLVEQTRVEAERTLLAAGLDDDVEVHVLMGGVEEQRWVLQPERHAVLIGTQDMLLSRALNRGYAMGRAAWPRAFGLLNTDSLWVMDEVQLMGVGLATSAQLQAFWNVMSDLSESPVSGPRATWWMSATLQPDWLRSPETADSLPELETHLFTVGADERSGPQWQAEKALEHLRAAPDSWVDHIVAFHDGHAPDPATGRQTVVVVNTVKRARELFDALRKMQGKQEADTAFGSAELRLIHSRFRPVERESWVDSFLSRKTLHPELNRILVATQVVEAGVDISASCLVTEIAPWPSLVQRFGRAARYGGRSQLVVLDGGASTDKDALPYSLEELQASRVALESVSAASILELEEYEQQLRDQRAAFLQRLYPFHPLHLLQRGELEELFDTSPDLAGADLDISRFIREGEDRDVHVFWRDFAEATADIQASRDELCRVSLADARGWVDRLLKKSERVWSWDYLEGQWVRTKRTDLRPGQVLLVGVNSGGYDVLRGFTGEAPKRGTKVLEAHAASARPAASLVLAEQLSEQSALHETLSQCAWKTIATHNAECAEIISGIASDLDIDQRTAQLLALVARFHDWGKAHPAFSEGTYRVTPQRTDLAKAPPAAWRSPRQLYNTSAYGHRRGFRHELASCLGMLELLRGDNPKHQSLTGKYASLFEARGIEIDGTGSERPGSCELASELGRLNPREMNLVLYLVAAHHGKVRVSMQAAPADQEYDDERGEGMPIRGVCDGDALPSTVLPAADGTWVEVPAQGLHLDIAALGLSHRYGESWTARVIELIDHFGVFELGYLEALVRAADARASMLQTADARLNGCTLEIPPATESATPGDVATIPHRQEVASHD